MLFTVVKSTKVALESDNILLRMSSLRLTSRDEKNRPALWLKVPTDHGKHRRIPNSFRLFEMPSRVLHFESEDSEEDPSDSNGPQSFPPG